MSSNLPPASSRTPVIIPEARALLPTWRLRQGARTRTMYFVLSNDVLQIRSVLHRLQDGLASLCGCDADAVRRVGLALHEALVNAMHHGNLELSSRLREPDDGRYDRLADERQRQAPYRDRRVHVASRESRRGAVYVVRDEGPGFDVAQTLAAAERAEPSVVSGRGLLLIRAMVDEVRWNARGNEITLIKHPMPAPCGKASRTVIAKRQSEAS